MAFLTGVSSEPLWLLHAAHVFEPQFGKNKSLDE
jgi:hypothetical protein